MANISGGSVTCAYCGLAYPDEPGAQEEMQQHEARCQIEWRKEKVGYHDTPANPDPNRAPLKNR